MEDSPWLHQIRVLRGMSELSGTLHEAQVLQLKIWPKVVFGDAAKAVARVKLEIGGGGVAEFTITIPKGEPTGLVSRKEGAKVLAGWVRELLGLQVEVKVVVNGKSFKTK